MELNATAGMLYMRSPALDPPQESPNLQVDAHWPIKATLRADTPLL
jgi:hypothetical protein